MPRLPFVLASLLILPACATERVITKPEIVRVVETQTVPVPADLTETIPPAPIPDRLTYGEGAVLWRQDRDTIEILNARLRAIQGLSDEPVED